MPAYGCPSKLLSTWQSNRTNVSHNTDFVLPLFVGNNDDSVEPMESMPAICRFGPNKAVEYLEPLVHKQGLRAVLLSAVATKSDRCRFESQFEAGQFESSDSMSEHELESSLDSSASRASLASLSSSSTSAVAVGGSIVANSQNPFIESRNEEDQVHLLSEPPEGNMMSPIDINVDSRPSTSRPDKAADGHKALGYKVTKAMALKEQFNPLLRLIPKLRAAFPSLLIICEVSLCAFTSAGFSCVFDERLKFDSTDDEFTSLNEKDKERNEYPIESQITCQYLATLSVEYATRGCHVVAPNDIVDGRVGLIRARLDEHRLHHVAILSCSAKFASGLFRPFRQASHLGGPRPERKSRQQPCGSASLALRSVASDLNQGADLIMVKPASLYLDIVSDIRREHDGCPIAVFHSSGEYMMLKLAADANVIDLDQALAETMTCFRRAGANLIISYFVPQILAQLCPRS